jgi:hypothetical protein
VPAIDLFSRVPNSVTCTTIELSEAAQVYRLMLAPLEVLPTQDLDVMPQRNKDESDRIYEAKSEL